MQHVVRGEGGEVKVAKIKSGEDLDLRIYGEDRV